MKAEALWKEFLRTGSPEAYLRYRQARKSAPNQGAQKRKH